MKLFLIVSVFFILMGIHETRAVLPLSFHGALARDMKKNCLIA